MGKAKITRKRRLRHTAKQVLKHGKSAKRAHKRIGGRSGHIFHKKTKA